VGSHDLLHRLASGRGRPALHTPGTHPLWTDSHNSRGMLDAHLDPGHDLASRRPATIDAAVEWLAGWAPAGGRMLDLGCGPGLYAERLAAAGFRVTGVDFSARSIAYARARPGGARYVVGDYREIELDETFDVILMIYLDFGTHSPANVRGILERVRRWLAPGGVFVFDVAAPEHRQGSERRDWGVEDRGFWSAQPHAWLARTLRYDDGPTYLDEHTIVTAGELRIYRTWERCYTPEAIEAALGEAGLVVRSMHSDLTGTPYGTNASTTIGVVAALDR